GMDFISVDTRIVAIDVVRGRMTVDLEFMPHGRFDQEGGRLAVPVEVDVSDIGNDEFRFPAGKKMFSREVELGFREGTAADYPFDRYHARLELLVWEPPAGGVDGDGRPVLVDFGFRRFHHGFRVNAGP